jgi:hypothetical protein
MENKGTNPLQDRCLTRRLSTYSAKSPMWLLHYTIKSTMIYGRIGPAGLCAQTNNVSAQARCSSSSKTS